MNKAKVKLHTRLRNAVGKDQLDIEMATSPNLGSLLGHLSKEYPKLKPLLEGEFGHKHLMIAINNNHVGLITEEVLKRRINDNDLVTIAEPSAAG